MCHSHHQHLGSRSYSCRILDGGEKESIMSCSMTISSVCSNRSCMLQHVVDYKASYHEAKAFEGFRDRRGAEDDVQPSFESGSCKERIRILWRRHRRCQANNSIVRVVVRINAERFKPKFSCFIPKSFRRFSWTRDGESWSYSLELQLRWCRSFLQYS